MDSSSQLRPAAMDEHAATTETPALPGAVAEALDRVRRMGATPSGVDAWLAQQEVSA